MYKDPRQDLGRRNNSYTRDIRGNVLPKFIEL